MACGAIQAMGDELQVRYSICAMLCSSLLESDTALQLRVKMKPGAGMRHLPRERSLNGTTRTYVKGQTTHAPSAAASTVSFSRMGFK